MELDSPWKEALDIYFEAFLAFCFPHVHREIDWSRSYQPLDKELQSIAPTGQTGRRVVDKLMRVWRINGQEEWILVHVEVQNHPDREFPRRIFVYHYRLLDRYNKSVVSLAVLGDEQADWRPDGYEQGLCGCRVTFRFPIIKLVDYAQRPEELEGSSNPFAVVVLAHLKAQQTRGDAESRYNWKWSLVRMLYDRGLSAEPIRQLFRFIDWMMDLPQDLETAFTDQLHQLEQEKHMPYVTSVERLAHEKGMQQGMQQGMREGISRGLISGIRSVLEVRFGDRAGGIIQQIEQLADAEILAKVLEQAKTVEQPEQLASIWT
jgi:hypothetical protein